MSTRSVDGRWMNSICRNLCVDPDSSPCTGRLFSSVGSIPACAVDGTVTKTDIALIPTAVKNDRRFDVVVDSGTLTLFPFIEKAVHFGVFPNPTA